MSQDIQKQSQYTEFRKRIGNDGDVSDLTATVSVENIGGIEEADISISPGITILSGENATNRTSLLHAINTVLGGEFVDRDALLKQDADSATVSLQFNGVEFYRDYERRGESIVTSGEPFCDHQELVDTYVTFLEYNDARRVVERGGDLREVLMRPVDTDEIEREISDKKKERESAENRIESIQRKLDNEANLIDRQRELENGLTEIEDQIEDAQETIEQHEDNVELAEEAEELVDELERKREILRGKQDRLKNRQDNIEAYLQDREDAEDELIELFKTHKSDTSEVSKDEIQEFVDSLSDDTTESIPSIDADIQKIFTDRKGQLQGQLNDLHEGH